MFYLNGNGVTVDWSAAANWIEKAAHKDHSVSQFQLGVMYCTGKGVPQDLARAIVWYELAAELGHPLAQYNLAVLLAKGHGCDKDPTRARFWFEKAAGQGLPAAQAALDNELLRSAAIGTAGPSAGRAKQCGAETVPTSMTE
jgi:TPR repeat protein